MRKADKKDRERDSKRWVRIGVVRGGEVDITWVWIWTSVRRALWTKGRMFCGRDVVLLWCCWTPLWISRERASAVGDVYEEKSLASIWARSAWMELDSSVSLTEKDVSNWEIRCGTISLWSALRLLRVRSMRMF